MVHSIKDVYIEHTYVIVHATSLEIIIGPFMSPLSLLWCCSFWSDVENEDFGQFNGITQGMDLAQQAVCIMIIGPSWLQLDDFCSVGWQRTLLLAELTRIQDWLSCWYSVNITIKSSDTILQKFNLPQQ